MTTTERQRRALAVTAASRSRPRCCGVVAWASLQIRHDQARRRRWQFGALAARVPEMVQARYRLKRSAASPRGASHRHDFAGQIAEAKFLGRRPRYGMHCDNQNAVDMAFRFCGSQETREAYLKYCFLVSRDLVNLRWSDIKLLAAALLERQTIKYQDAIEVVSPREQGFEGEPGERGHPCVTRLRG